MELPADHCSHGDITPQRVVEDLAQRVIGPNGLPPNDKWAARPICMLTGYAGETGDATSMKVWIDQDLCTGDGLCEEIAPDVFTLLDDGLAYVREGDKIYATAKGNPQGADGMADIPDGQLDGVIESAEECPGECIFIEP